MGQATVATLASRYWRLAAEPALADVPELLDTLIDRTWPYQHINKAQLDEIGEVVDALPAALANEALASGVPLRDIVAAFADALDPP
ncbi:MAG TPA: hypothetical protein VHY83_01960 [Solirubrobacteraceae bacterium]|jgi:hypothetical protein|nr:hypothetical protein [Solirubrobacteraceae bacterium]